MTRPVETFKIKAIYRKTANGQTRYGNIDRYEKSEFQSGVFHQFGCDVEEDEQGFSSYSTAIIELEDGVVINQPLNLFRFTDGGQSQ